MTAISGVGSEADSHPVVYQDRLVAIVGPARCHLLAELDDDDLRIVLAMCLFNREVREGRAAGPFSSEGAERWAAAVLTERAHD
jgi:hypothetical protein